MNRFGYAELTRTLASHGNLALTRGRAAAQLHHADHQRRRPPLAAPVSQTGRGKTHGGDLAAAALCRLAARQRRPQLGHLRPYPAELLRAQSPEHSHARSPGSIFQIRYEPERSHENGVNQAADLGRRLNKSNSLSLATFMSVAACKSLLECACKTSCSIVRPWRRKLAASGRLTERRTP